MLKRKSVGGRRSGRQEGRAHCNSPYVVVSSNHRHNVLPLERFDSGEHFPVDLVSVSQLATRIVAYGKNGKAVRQVHRL